MGREINLDVARAAREEKQGPPPTVVFKGVEFTLPHEMPFAFVEAVYRMNASENDAESAEILSEMASALFGDRLSEFRKLYPSISDFEALMEMTAVSYATSLGESQASEA